MIMVTGAAVASALKASIWPEFTALNSAAALLGQTAKQPRRIRRGERSGVA